MTSSKCEQKEMYNLDHNNGFNAIFLYSVPRSISYSALVLPYKELEETANERAAQHARDDVIEAVLC